MDLFNDLSGDAQGNERIPVDELEFQFNSDGGPGILLEFKHRAASP
jgi:hypothetical protein